MRRLLYVAHPLAPTQQEITEEEYHYEDPTGHALRRNIDLALRWLAWLRVSFPGDTFIAPWIATVLSLNGDDSPELREAGLRDDCATVERCDGIVLCGSRVSSGMQREQEHAKTWHFAARFDVLDLTVLGLREPPTVVTGMTLDAWLSALVSHNWTADGG